MIDSVMSKVKKACVSFAELAGWLTIVRPEIIARYLNAHEDVISVNLKVQSPSEARKRISAESRGVAGELPEPKVGYLLLPCIDPKGAVTGTKTAKIGWDKIQNYAQYGPGHKYEEVKCLVPETLVNPHWCCQVRFGEVPGYCFARSAEFAVGNDGRRLASPEDKVFVVILNQDLKVIEWGWEDENPTEKYRPLVLEGRLEEVILPRNV